MDSIHKRSSLAFFILVYALSIPFWVSGALSQSQLLPGLPLSALGFVCPLLAAAILVYRQEGRAGLSALLKRSFDIGRVKPKTWLLPVVLLQPCVMAFSYFVLRMSGVSVPPPQFSLLSALALLLAFFIGGLAEELGWMGYAIDPLQARFGMLGASLLLGVVWSLWHYIPLLEVGRSAAFITWWTLGTLAYRVTIVWLYNHTGKSVFVAAFYHAMINLTWQLFPINGSYYDPRVTGLIAAALAVLLVIAWRIKTPSWRGQAVG
jgi:membrane protease YdiL (CAAX protease family)